MEKYPADSHYLKIMKTILDSYPQHSPPLHPTQLTNQLYIGNQDNADDTILLQDLGITHVLNCVGSRNFELTRSPYPPEVNIKGFLIIPAQDFDEFNIMQFFDDAIGFLDSAICSGGKALVHCSIGVNRSGAIVAAYLMISQSKKLLDVIVELKAKRLLILCNMGFRKQLVQFARANDLLDEVEFEQPKPETEDNHADKESERTSYRENPKEKDTSSEQDDSEIDDADEIRIKEKVIDLKALARKGYPIRHNIETLEEAKGVMLWSQLKDEEKLELFSDKMASKGTDTKPSSVHTIKNFKNVDPSIVLKVMNESYDKYKMNNYKSPLEYKYSDKKKFEYKSPFRQNLDSKMRMHGKALNQEVDDFLSTTSSPIVKKYSDVRKLLDPLKNKEDENIIWGKSPSPSPASKTPLPNLQKSSTSTSKSSSNSSEVKFPPKSSSSTASPNLQHISKYATTHLPSQSTPLKHSEIIRKISNKQVKPLSYYKLQVLNEQLSNKSHHFTPSSSSNKPSSRTTLASANLPKSTYFKPK